MFKAAALAAMGRPWHGIVRQLPCHLVVQSGVCSQPPRFKLLATPCSCLVEFGAPRFSYFHHLLRRRPTVVFRPRRGGREKLYALQTEVSGVASHVTIRGKKIKKKKERKKEAKGFADVIFLKPETGVQTYSLETFVNFSVSIVSSREHFYT